MDNVTVMYQVVEHEWFASYQDDGGDYLGVTDKFETLPELQDHVNQQLLVWLKGDL